MVKNGIYGYYDTEKNQMAYVGQSEDIYKRHNHHMSSSLYNRQVINRILQNNPDRYELVIIKSRPNFSKEDRDILEKHYIEFYNTFADENKFNYTPGGDSCPSLLQSVKDKISEANSGLNNPNYGKHHTEETIEKIRKANLGKNFGVVGKNHPMYGKHHSEETKRKMILSKNTTGYLRVHLRSCPTCKSGKIYCYQYSNDDGRQKSIQSVNLKKLKEKVLKAGLPWEKIN